MALKVHNMTCQIKSILTLSYVLIIQMTPDFNFDNWDRVSTPRGSVRNIGTIPTTHMVDSGGHFLIILKAGCNFLRVESWKIGLWNGHKISFPMVFTELKSACWLLRYRQFCRFIQGGTLQKPSNFRIIYTKYITPYWPLKFIKI